MLRAVLLGTLSVLAVASCKKTEGTSASAKVVPGVAAGKVLEVKGGVSVKHGDETKPLAVGDTVEADDTVITTPDGNVVIELAHNNVRWELGPNKQQKVRESIAFKAAKSTGPAADVEQDTAAAGRPAERSAVGTTATAVEAKEEEAAPAPGAAAPAAAAPAAPQAADEGAKQDAPAPAKKRTSRPSRRAAPKDEAELAIPSAEAAMAPAAESPRRTTRGGPMIIAKPAPAPPPPPPGASASSATASASLDAKSGGGGGAAPQTLVAHQMSELHACMTGHADAITLIVSVASGKPVVKITSKTAVSAGIQACMKRVVGAISFGADGKASVVVKP